jgi:hypothetical protein
MKEMSTGNIKSYIMGVKRNQARRAGDLAAICEAVFKLFVNLNISQPYCLYGPIRG